MMVGWRKAIHLEARVAQLEAEKGALELSLNRTRADRDRIGILADSLRVHLRQAQEQLADRAGEGREPSYTVLRAERDLHAEMAELRGKELADRDRQIASLQSAAEHARRMILRQRKRIRRLKREATTVTFNPDPSGLISALSRHAGPVIPRNLGIPEREEEPEYPAANEPRDASIEPMPEPEGWRFLTQDEADAQRAATGATLGGTEQQAHEATATKGGIPVHVFETADPESTPRTTRSVVMQARRQGKTETMRSIREKLGLRLLKRVTANPEAPPPKHIRTTCHCDPRFAYRDANSVLCCKGCGKPVPDLTKEGTDQ